MRETRNDMLPAEQPESYSPALTEKVKRQVVSEIVASGRDMLRNSTNKIDLSDMNQLVSVVDKYLERCVRIGVLPTMQGVAASCGCSRRWIYKYLDEHEDEESAEYLERLRATFTQMRIEAVDKSAAKEVLSIFLLKNSSQGFRDKIDFEPIPPRDALSDLDVETARKRILDAIPIDDDD